MKFARCVFLSLALLAALNARVYAAWAPSGQDEPPCQVVGDLVPNAPPVRLVLSNRNVYDGQNTQALRATLRQRHVYRLVGDTYADLGLYTQPPGFVITLNNEPCPIYVGGRSFTLPEQSGAEFRADADAVKHFTIARTDSTPIPTRRPLSLALIDLGPVPDDAPDVPGPDCRPILPGVPLSGVTENDADVDVYTMTFPSRTLCRVTPTGTDAQGRPAYVAVNTATDVSSDDPLQYFGTQEMFPVYMVYNPTDAPQTRFVQVFGFGEPKPVRYTVRLDLLGNLPTTPQVPDCAGALPLVPGAAPRLLRRLGPEAPLYLFKADLVAGEVYQLAGGLVGYTDAIWPWYFLGDDCTAPGSRIPESGCFRAERTGTQTIGVSPFLGPGAIQLRHLTDFPNNAGVSRDAPAPVSAGTRVVTDAGPDARGHFFRLDLPAGVSRLRVEPLDGLRSLRAIVYENCDNPLYKAPPPLDLVAGEPGTLLLLASPGCPGSYALEVYPVGAPDAPGPRSYRLRVEPLGTIDQVTPASAAPITLVPGAGPSVIRRDVLGPNEGWSAEPGDAVFEFPVRAGNLYRVGIDEQAGEPRPTFMLWNGTLEAAMARPGSDEAPIANRSTQGRTIFIAPETGLCRVRSRRVLATGPARLVQGVTLRDAGPVRDDRPGDDAGGPIAAPCMLVGSLDYPTDVDRRPVTLQARTRYRLSASVAGGPTPVLWAAPDTGEPGPYPDPQYPTFVLSPGAVAEVIYPRAVTLVLTAADPREDLPVPGASLAGATYRVRAEELGPLADIAALDGSPGHDGRVTCADLVLFFKGVVDNDPRLADVASPGGALGGDGLVTPDDLVAFFASVFAAP